MTLTLSNPKRNIKMPNFFLVGAGKCGTTSLAYYLDQHPEVFMSPVKEPFFFVPDTGLNNYDEYISLFEGSEASVAVGEASPGYLFDEKAPGLIHAAFPEAKIIIILRNPVDMIFSFWQFMVSLGYEKEDFEVAISDAERNIRKSEFFKKTCRGWWANYLYIERALYYEQVKRYIDTFGRSKVSIYIFERFFGDPLRYCQDIFRFLEVKSDFVPDCKRINEGGTMRFRLIEDIRSMRYPILRRLIPFKYRTNLRVLVHRLNLKKGEKQRMNISTRKYLERMFCADIEQLESLIEAEIPEWKAI